MELTPQDIDLIDRHFKNELSKDELSSFNSRMESDPAFAEEVINYLKAIDAVKAIGRQQLRTELLGIQKELENSGGFDSYKRSKIKKGGKGSGFGGFAIFIMIIAGVIYYFYSHKEAAKKIDEMMAPSEMDTVYHYNIKKDTLIKSNERQIKKYKIADTLYYDQHGNKIERKKGREIINKKDSDKTQIIYQNKIINELILDSVK